MRRVLFIVLWGLMLLHSENLILMYLLIIYKIIIIIIRTRKINVKDFQAEPKDKIPSKH